MKRSVSRIIAAVFMTAAFFSCTTTPRTVGSLTTPIDDSAWSESEWISAPDAEVFEGIVQDGDRAADGSSWFVRSLENEAPVMGAKWMTTGLGVYDLYINGVLVGDEILKPGFTHFAKTKRSFTYDVTEAINAAKGAENVFSAQLTPGWWGDKIITPAGNDGMIGKRTAFRSVIELTFADGSKKLFGTNTTDWKAGVAGPVKHAAIFDGEDYDAREAMGFDCADNFGAPIVNDEFSGEILPTDGAEIYMRKDLALSPVVAYVWEGVTGDSEDEYGTVNILKQFKDGETITVEPGQTLVVDFGQNCAAEPSFSFKAAEGTVLTCLPSELLNDGNGAKSRGMDGPEGSCHRLNLRIPETGMILTYTFAGKDIERFTPRSTFFGYRFVSITATDKVEIRSIESIPVSSIAEDLETGVITTGSDDINKLISNTVWGQRSNYLSVSTDCPQRNERLGWTADTQVFVETGTFFANTDPFFHKWTRDMRDSQSPRGGFPGVAPKGQYGADENNMMRVGWSDAGVIVPWTIWKQFDDISIIDENWGAMDRYMDHVAATKYDHEALVAENGNFQWADWLSYEDLETCNGKHVSHMDEAIRYWDYLSASYWMIDAGMMRDMAAASGKDVEKYAQMTEDAKAYLQQTFLNENGEFKTPVLNTMQTPALFALKNELVEGDAKDNMIARLRQNFADHDNCLQTGFLGTSILMKTLTDNGMEDIAYDLLFQHKNPSWLYSVDNGATTIWERWNSYTFENGMGPRGMNSFNHYAYGAVCQWIWETAAGICADPAKPGFKHIIMSPIPDKRLGSIKAEYNSAAGLITSEWKYDGDEWVWNFTIPMGATATVTLPGETESKEYEAGSYRIVK